MKKPLMIDLCCGRGGWSKGFIAAGWRCIGYDIKEQPDYPDTFRRRDLLKLDVMDLVQADFICASTPCEQFSLFRMKHFFPNPPYPAIGLQLFQHAATILIQSGRPFIMENVHAAQQFVGPSVQHCGSFHLWGSGVPPIFPAHLYHITKGIYLIPGSRWAKLTMAERKEERRKKTPGRYGSGSRGRAEFTARCAEIPFDLAFYVGTIARNNLAAAPAFPSTPRAAKPATVTATA